MQPHQRRVGLKYQSLINKCKHGVFRPFGDPQGKSSVCEICNSQEMRTYTSQPSKAIKRKIEKHVRPVQVEIFEEGDGPKEQYAETNVTETNYSEA